MKLEVMLAKLAAAQIKTAQQPKPLPPPTPMGVKQPAPPKLAPPVPGAVSPLGSGKPPPPAPTAPAPVPPTGGPPANTGLAPQPGGGGGGGMGGMFGGLHGMAAGASPEDMGKFMNMAAPITKGVAGIGGLPAIAGLMDHVRGGNNLATLTRGPGG